MIAQAIVDGLIAGSMIGLGAIGITLTYSILRFANFAHGELISWGAYAALGVSSALAIHFAPLSAPDRPLLLRLVAAAGACRLDGADRPSGACSWTCCCSAGCGRGAAP